MDTYPYYGPGNIAIDVCSSCQVIWLDSGELRAIEQAPGSDRGGQAVHLRWRRDAQIRHDQKKSKKQTRVGD